MENENRNNTLLDFLLALHRINLKWKEPPDERKQSQQPVSGGLAGGPKSR